MKKEIKDYLLGMVSEFNDGNDNEYGKGKKVSFKFEEIEKGDCDFYDEEDVKMFYEVRDYLKEEVKMEIGDIEYSFKVSKKDIVCSFIEV
jgi:hypothetical protein